jgi:hypothetical protein
MDYRIYPNRNGHRPSEEQRGVVRVGMVEENADTKRQGVAGHFAAVTHEADGEVRFYVFTATSKESKFPNNPLWMGPYIALSEEIVDDKQLVEEGA